MSTPTLRIVIATVAVLVGAVGAAAAQGSDALERQRIAEERAATGARFREREVECLRRFVTTSCVEEARQARRADLARLQQRQIVLDDSRRRARAAERTESIRQRKQAEARQSERAKAPRAALEPGRSASSGQGGRSADERSAPRSKATPVGRIGAAPRTGSALSADQRTRNHAVFDAAQREAAEHRAEVEARVRARADRKKPAPPLPVPPGVPSP